MTVFLPATRKTIQWKFCECFDFLLFQKRVKKRGVEQWDVFCGLTLVKIVSYPKAVQGCWKAWKSGVPVLFGGHNLPPLVEIGLTDLPKSGGAMAPPAPPGTTGLVFEIKEVRKSRSPCPKNICSVVVDSCRNFWMVQSYVEENHALLHRKSSTLCASLL